MGILLDLFLEPYRIVPELFCGTCKHVVEDPVMLLPCEDTFCKKCIDSLHNGQTDEVTVLSCPVDNQAISGTRTPPKIYASLLGKLELRCPFYAKGCKVTMKLDASFLEHRQNCEFDQNVFKAVVEKAVHSVPAVVSCSGVPGPRSNPNNIHPQTVYVDRYELYVKECQLPLRFGNGVPEKIRRLVFEELKGDGAIWGRVNVVWPRTALECLAVAVRMERALDAKLGLPGVWRVIVKLDGLPKDEAGSKHLAYAKGRLVLMLRDMEIVISVALL